LNRDALLALHLCARLGHLLRLGRMSEIAPERHST
jgi:hypothetical protein